MKGETKMLNMTTICAMCVALAAAMKWIENNSHNE